MLFRSTDGTVGAEKHVTLAQPYKVYGGTTKVAVTLDPDATLGTKEKVITITKINGVANEAAVKTAKGQLVVLSKELPRAVLVEEFTGTGCPWCPRGMAGMAKMAKTFGEKFAGVALHNFNQSDPMSISYDRNVGLEGAPSCRLNRGQVMDPYYGTGEDIADDFRKELTVLPFVGITLTGVYDKATEKVTAEATIEPLVSGNFKLAYVLTADGLTGDENAWKQANNYAQFDQNRLPDDMKPYGKGGEFGQKMFKGVFDDVAIASSFSGAAVDLPALTENNVVKNSYTLALPTKQPLRKAINVEKMHVIAFLLDAKGKVVNAVKAPVKDVLGVNGVIASENIKEVARYTIDGRRINEPQAGINIVKMSDGTTVKVLVK